MRDLKESWQLLLARFRSGRISRLRDRLSARGTTIGGAWRGVHGDARDAVGFSDPGNRGGPLGACDEMFDGGDSTRFPPGSRPRARKAG